MYTNVREMLEEKLLRAYRDGAYASSFCVGEKLIIFMNVQRLGACLSEGKSDEEWEEFVKRTEANISEEEVLENARKEAESLQAWRREFAKSRCKY